MQDESEIAGIEQIESNFTEVYENVCRQGYSFLGQTNPHVTQTKANPWQYQSAYPPSYGAAARYRFLKTLQLAESLKPRRVFEVAAGDGFLSACLCRFGRTIFANDLRPVKPVFSQWLNGEYIKFVQGNVLEMRADSFEPFDLVLAAEVLEHVAHGEDFLTKLKTFLRPGGHVLLTTPNGSYFRSKLPTFSQVADFRAFEARQFGPDSDDHLFLYTAGELKMLLEKTGFTNIRFYFFITPWLSGHCLFRFLPSAEFFWAFYFQMDSLVRSMGPAVQKKICTQLVAIAERPAE